MAEQRQDEDLRCFRVSARFWTDEKVATWGDDARLLALYLLTSPHRTMEGLYRLPLAYAAADLGWAPDRVRSALDRLIADGFCRYDARTSVVWLCHALRYQPVTHPNHIRAAVRSLRALPRTPLLRGLLEAAKSYSPLLAQAIEAASDLALGQEPAGSGLPGSFDPDGMGSGSDPDPIGIRSGSDPDRIGVASGSHRGRIGVASGSDRDGIGVGSGSDRDPTGVGPGSDRDPIGIRSGSDRDGIGIGSGSDPDRIGIASGSSSPLVPSSPLPPSAPQPPFSPTPPFPPIPPNSLPTPNSFLPPSPGEQPVPPYPLGAPASPDGAAAPGGAHAMVSGGGKARAKRGMSPLDDPDARAVAAVAYDALKAHGIRNLPANWFARAAGAARRVLTEGSCPPTATELREAIAWAASDEQWRWRSGDLLHWRFGLLVAAYQAACAAPQAMARASPRDEPRGFQGIRELWQELATAGVVDGEPTGFLESFERDLGGVAPPGPVEGHQHALGGGAVPPAPGAPVRGRHGGGAEAGGA